MKLHFARMVSALLLPIAGMAQVVEITGEGTPSQTSEWQGGLYPAELAVDGDPATFSHTDSVTPNNAWQLDFAEETDFSRIELQMRADCCGGRLSGAVVRLFDSDGESVFSESLVDPGAGGLVVVEVPEGIEARTLRIGLEKGNPNPGTSIYVLHLGEVRVFAGEPARTRIVSFAASDETISSGQAVTLSWETDHATTVALTGQGPVPAEGSITVRPFESTIYYLHASSDLGIATASVSIVVDRVALSPRISEFMASNRETLERSDGSSPDWIEIWNANPFALDLTGYRLAELGDPDDSFVFPALTLAANSYLVIDAAREALDGIPATGFPLDRSEGGVLRLSNPTGEVIQEVAFPEQHEDVSYGLASDPASDGEGRFFLEPTPGRSNQGTVVKGFVKDTKFSVPRGFYQEPQVVAVSSKTDGAEIFVTLDGSVPGPDNPRAFRYSEALEISETTTLRARAFREGLAPTNIDTVTYLFPAQVAEQSASPVDFPDRWIPNLNVGVQANPVRALASYGLSDRVLGTLPLVDSPGSDFSLPEALTAIPTMSLAMDSSELFDPVHGLHLNATRRGRRWERAASVEFLDPVSEQHLQADCGLRMHGGWNRFPEMLKKSFRLYFRSEYGDRNFEAPLFKNPPTREFDRLILRSGNGKSWASPWRALSGGGNSLPRTTYFRDQLARDLQAATGQDFIPGHFVHLYLNGHYWGLYNPVERPDEFLASGHLGGDDDDYDVIKWQRGAGHQVAAGDDTGWNELIALVRGTPENSETYREIAKRLDLENLVDYLLVNYFLGNQDWVDNNVYAMRNREADGPFRFYCWDSEETLLSPGRNSTTQNVPDTCTEIHHRLRGNPEYRLLFADRAQRHLFHGGALTQSVTGALVEAYAALLDRAIVGESARWGALHRPAAPYDRDDWLAEIDNLRRNYLPRRGGILLGQLRDQGLFPALAAPMVQPGPGGTVEQGLEVTFAPSPGTVHFTLDGSDPRLPGGAVSPESEAFELETVESPLVTMASVWHYRDTGEDLGGSDLVWGTPGYDATHWKHPDFDDGPWAIGEAPLGYGGIRGQTIATTVEFGGDLQNKYPTTYFRQQFEVSKAGDIDELSLRMFCDDGALVYLNGVEVVRIGFPETDLITFDRLAAPIAAEGEILEFAIPVEVLREGKNALAVEIHQSSPGSSDLGFDLALTGIRKETISTPIMIEGATVVKARVRHQGQWSPLQEARFQTGDRAQDLVVSEMMYHPLPGAAEYLEIWNRGESSHFLGDLKISGGITFDFGKGGDPQIAPGQRILLVRDREVFRARYPDTPVYGAYLGALGNGGDRFSLETTEGLVLWTISYDDGPLWPASADGLGRSLVYRGGPWDAPSSWRPSVEPGGSPGGRDELEFEPGRDLLAYRVVAMRMGAGGIFELETRLGSDDARHLVEWSDDLKTWQRGALRRLSAQVSGRNLLERWRLDPQSTGEARWFRVRVLSERP